MLRPLPFPLPAFAAPVEVILLVCISSPIYLRRVRLRSVTKTVYSRDLRLKELISAFELLVLRLDHLDTIYNLQETCLKGLRLTGEGCQCGSEGGASLGVSG